MFSIITSNAFLLLRACYKHRPLELLNHVHYRVQFYTPPPLSTPINVSPTILDPTTDLQAAV
jgi:hypothetical protein